MTRVSERYAPSITSRYTLLFRGAPIGTIELQLSGRSGGGHLTPSPRFATVRDEIVDASRALTSFGALPPDEPDAGSAAAFERADALCCEMQLRDEQGEHVPTQWINIFGARTDGDPLSVLVVFGKGGTHL